MMYSNPELLHKILRKVTDVVKLYMEKQIQSGIDVVQIFDSWAAAIEPSRYDEFSWSYMVEIAEYLKEKYPHIPVIMFPKGIPAFLDKVYGNFDVFGVEYPYDIGQGKTRGPLCSPRKYGAVPFVLERADHRMR
jgi:uroporphyrinogen decarboxylase